MNEDPQAPYRLCCGKRHFGVMCPDGKVMCCLCFCRVPQDQLHVSPEGLKTNVCLPCAAFELRIIRDKLLVALRKRKVALRSPSVNEGSPQ